MKTLLSVKLEGAAGAMIDDILTEANAVASRLGLRVEIEINGIAMSIRPGLVPLSVINAYQTGRSSGATYVVI